MALPVRQAPIWYTYGMKEAEPRTATGRFAYPKRLRLRKKKEFDRVFAEGRRAYGRDVSALYAPNGLAWTRIGLIAGKRVGKAVERNRAKRVFREAFRLHRESLPAGYDLVIVVRRAKERWTLEKAVGALLSVAESIGGESSSC